MTDPITGQMMMDEIKRLEDEIKRLEDEIERLSTEHSDLEVENQSLADRNWRLTEKIVRSVSHFDARSELHTSDHDCLLTMVSLLRSVDPRSVSGTPPTGDSESEANLCPCPSVANELERLSTELAESYSKHVVNGLKSEIERLRAERDAARRCHIEAEKANTRLGETIERLTADIKDMARVANAQDETIQGLTAVKDALTGLVALKNHRDKHGKTDEYLARKPNAWKYARRALEGES